MSQLTEPGGTPGGLGTFIAGAALTGISAWFFVDSVRVTSYGSGWMTGIVGGSAGVIFLPLLIALIALFYNAKKMWAWGLLAVAIAIIGVEILSKLQFFFNLKLSHFLIMLAGFSAGIGITLRSLKAISAQGREQELLNSQQILGKGNDGTGMGQAEREKQRRG